MAKQYVVAIDEGTTSTRCIVFDKSGSICGVGQQEFEQIMPQPGWVEHDAAEIMAAVLATTEAALKAASITAADVAAVGVTNQRETTVAWSKSSGKPLCNALVWMDTRTQDICVALEKDGGQDRFREKTGLPVATYFSATKMKWMMEKVDLTAKSV